MLVTIPKTLLEQSNSLDHDHDHDCGQSKEKRLRTEQALFQLEHELEEDRLPEPCQARTCGETWGLKHEQ